MLASRKRAIPRSKNNEQLTGLAIVYRDIDKLQSDPKNPRVHSKKQVQQIARSIEAFGFNVPFLVDRKLQLIAGHGRLAACKLLKIREVPTISLDHLTQPQIRAFMIADNRLTENAAWDDRLLAEHFKAFSAVKLDFNLEATGFEMGEIDVLIEGLECDDKADALDPLPKSGSTVTVTKPGDLWLLGNNRLLCGDALEEETYALLMDGKRAAAVFTDPPYNDPIDGYVNGFGHIHHPEFAMASGEMTEAEFTEFLSKVLSHLSRASTLGSLHFVCIDWRHMKELLAASEHAYTEFKALCVWAKDSGGQGSLYRSQHELIFVFKSGNGKHRNNIQLGQFGRYRTNVWIHPRVKARTGVPGEENPAAMHPTVKPVSMVADAILDCTARGDIVLDAFMGSGTTLIAAERTGRISYGIELSPLYVDLAIRRWQAFTRRTAVHAKSGLPFTEIEVPRA